MGSLYVEGLRAALRRWPVVLVLFLANLTAGLLATAASWAWLEIALDNSLATRTLLTDLDTNVLVDLFVHHGESLRAWGVGGVGMGIVVALLSVWLNAAAVVAIGGDARLGGCLHRGLDLYPTYLGLWMITMLVNAGSIVTALLVGRALVRWTAESPAEVASYFGAGIGVAVGAGLLVFSATVHDHARVRSAATGAGFAHAYTWALNFVCRRQWRALVLTLALLGTGCSAWLIYQTVGTLVPTNSTLGLTVSVLWGEALLLARMLLRLWLFAAESELQNPRKAA